MDTEMNDLFATNIECQHNDECHSERFVQKFNIGDIVHSIPEYCAGLTHVVAGKPRQCYPPRDIKRIRKATIISVGGDGIRHAKTSVGEGWIYSIKTDGGRTHIINQAFLSAGSDL